MSLSVQNSNGSHFDIYVHVHTRDFSIISPSPGLKKKTIKFIFLSCLLDPKLLSEMMGLDLMRYILSLYIIKSGILDC